LIMTTTVTRTYDSAANARSVVGELKAIGIEEAEISVIARNDHHELEGVDVTYSTEDAGAVSTGAGIGGMVGGVAGMLAGLGLMAIPGVGPLVAAGWMATTAAGAATGAMAGAATGSIVSVMTDSGIEPHDAETYAEAVQRGAILISARTSESLEPRVVAIMDRNSPNDLTMKRAAWESEGWTRYDANAAPYPREQLRF
jgi:hypothetical protein